MVHNYQLNIKKLNQNFFQSPGFNLQRVDIETIFFRDFIQPFEGKDLTVSIALFNIFIFSPLT